MLNLVCPTCNSMFQTAKPAQRFCSAKCRVAHWSAVHIMKRKHPKRIRMRERERLYTIIHRGESLAYLREQAMEAVRVQALRAVEQ